MKAIFYRVLTEMMRWALRLLSQWRVINEGGALPEGPFILVANHRSLIDPPTLGACIPRRVIFMAKREAFKSLKLGWLVWAYGAFPVRRGQPDRQALVAAVQRLRQGQVLGLFPEGTRSRDGCLQRGHPGVALIAWEAGVPLVPVGITGTEQVRGLKALFSRPLITVRIGKAFTLPHSSGRPTPSQLREYSELIMFRIAEVLPEEYRGVYSKGILSGELSEARN